MNGVRILGLWNNEYIILLAYSYLKTMAIKKPISKLDKRFRTKSE